MCMRVHASACVQMMDTHMDASACVYMHVHACACVCMHVHASAYMHMMDAHLDGSACMWTHQHACACTYTHVHAPMCAKTGVYTCTPVDLLSQRCIFSWFSSHNLLMVQSILSLIFPLTSADQQALDALAALVAAGRRGWFRS